MPPLRLAVLFATIIQGILLPHFSVAQHADARNDTLNIIDHQGFRQGYWQILGSMQGEPGYKKVQVVEEGSYTDNKREGIWTKYYPSGSIKSEINYRNNHPKGVYKIYFPNGQLEEEGNWISNKNSGSFKRFHQNGKPAQEFVFNNEGKRNGTQMYYFENGQPQMIVEIENGVAHGMYRSFHPDGSIMEETRLINGQPDLESTKTYPAKSGTVTTTRTPEIPVSETKPADPDKPNLGEFKFNGFNALYNKNLQITQVGMFKDGRLYDGKWHRYDEHGILKKVEIYQNGRFTGYGNLE